MILQIKGRNVELSKREGQTFKLIAEGKCNKEIALALEVSVKTVEKFRQAVMNKLGIHDRVTLTHFALSRGVVVNVFAGEPNQ